MEKKSCFVVVGQAMPDIKQGKMFLPKHCQVKPDLHNGFTLIELLIVVLIIGILAAVAVPQYQKAVEKSRATEAVQWARTLAEAEEVYYMANGSYTTDWDVLGVEKPTTPYFYWDSALDPSVYNIRLKRTTDAYTIRYFMPHVEGAIKGRFMCVADPNNKLGTQVCRSLAVDKTGVAYPYSPEMLAYYLN